MRLVQDLPHICEYAVFKKEYFEEQFSNTVWDLYNVSMNYVHTLYFHKQIYLKV